MQEYFLHYLWQMQYFDKSNLSTTEAEPIEIFHPGYSHHDAGPDFTQAHLRIGAMEWVGNVEIHNSSHEWYDHAHQNDHAYDNVILHVVWSDDLPVRRRDASRLPTLELRHRVDKSLLTKYRQLSGSAFSIPCRRSLRDVAALTRGAMLSRMAAERLERKADEVEALCRKNQGDWEETFYQLLCANFGFKINAEPFQELARRVPVKFINRQRGSLDQVEAMLFGQAGFLHATDGDVYHQRLRREYLVLSKKFDLPTTTMSQSQWKYLRLRPANFPARRIAQLAALLAAHDRLFAGAISCSGRTELMRLFSTTPSAYWQKHYSFGLESPNLNELGEESIWNLIINTIAPLWAAYGRAHADASALARALRLLEEIPAESNSVIQSLTDAGFEGNRASDSQGMLELFNQYCKLRRCLDCMIGASLVRPNTVPS